MLARLGNLSARRFSSAFEAAQGNLKKLSSPPNNETKLKLYALFKQATAGDVTGSAPSRLNFVERAKYDAWSTLKGTSAEDAKKQYAGLVESLAAKEATAAAPSETKSSDKTEGLNITVTGGVMEIRFNRPSKYNAITLDMYKGIQEALKVAASDASVKLVLFKGTGDFYCSGNDLSFFEKAAVLGKEEFARIGHAVFQEFVATFIDFNKPIVAAVNGPAVGIAVTLLPLFNVVLASDTATFHTPFAALGQSAEGTSTYSFPLVMGPLAASEFLIFGRKLTAQEALTRGLVNEVFPKASFDAEVARRVAQYAQLPPESLRINATILRDVHREKLHQTNIHEAEVLRQRWLSDECEQAIIAFMSRKK